MLDKQDIVLCEGEACMDDAACCKENCMHSDAMVLPVCHPQHGFVKEKDAYCELYCPKRFVANECAEGEECGEQRCCQEKCIRERKEGWAEVCSHDFSEVLYLSEYCKRLCHDEEYKVFPCEVQPCDASSCQAEKCIAQFENKFDEICINFGIFLPVFTYCFAK